MEKLLVDIRGLSESITVKVPTIRKWLRQENAVPHVRIGRLLRFKLPQVLDWIDSRNHTRTDHQQLST